jgi:hypothetical protein
MSSFNILHEVMSQVTNEAAVSIVSLNRVCFGIAMWSVILKKTIYPLLSVRIIIEGEPG